MENLIEMTDIEIQKLMGRYDATEEETVLLLAALKNLKMWTGESAKTVVFFECFLWHLVWLLYLQIWFYGSAYKSKILCEIFSYEQLLCNARLLARWYFCGEVSTKREKVVCVLGFLHFCHNLKQLQHHKIKCDTFFGNFFTERQLLGDQSPITEFELHWSSYKSASNSPYGGNSPKFTHGQRPSTSSLPADTYLNAMSPQSPVTPPLSTPSSPLPVQQSPAESRRRYTPPPTPPLAKPHGKVRWKPLFMADSCLVLLWGRWFFTELSLYKSVKV